MADMEKFLKDVQASTKDMRDSLAAYDAANSQFATQVAALNEHLKELSEPARKVAAFVQQLNVDTSALRQWAEETSIPMRHLNDEMLQASESIRQFNSQINGLLSPALSEIFESFKQLPKRTQNAVALMADRGWFFDLEMPVPSIGELERAFQSESPEEAELALVEYFRERTAYIHLELSKAYPHRKKVLDAAFGAHSRGEYVLAIPVLLAQADGICKELINAELFRKRDGRPQTAEFVDTLEAETFMTAVLSPLASNLPISASSKERGQNFIGLNRHQVMHGETAEYGTEMNSFRAISLLNYVGLALKAALKD